MSVYLYECEGYIFVYVSVWRWVYLCVFVERVYLGECLYEGVSIWM